MRTSKLEQDLTKGDIGIQILRLALPLLVGVIAAILVTTVDTFFVAFLGDAALAAIGYTFPVAMAGVSLAFGLGIGATTIIGKEIGASRPQAARSAAFRILTISTLLVTVVSSVGFFFAEPLFRTLGVTPDLMPLVLAYMRPWFFGLVFLVLPIVGTAVIRGYGSTSIQAYVMLTAALSNAVLNPILIFGFGPIAGWGIAGAAWASVIAHAITMFVMLWFLLRPMPLIDTARVSLRDWIETGKTLLGLGLPAALVNALGPLATMIVLRLLSEIGHDAVAGFALGTRIEALALIPATALSMAIGPVISQNMAAGRLDRVAAAWRLVLQFTAVIGALAGLIFVAAPRLLTAPFAVSSDVAGFAEMYLAYIAFSLVASALIPAFSSMQSAMGNARPGLVTSLVRYAVFFVPGAWIGLSLGGAAGLLAGLAVAHILAGLLALAWGTAIFAASTQPLKSNQLKGAIQ